MIMAFTIDFQAALSFAVLIPLLCLVVFGIMLITMPMYKRVQAGLDRVTSATRQNLSGVRVLRAFCMEEAQTEAFEEKTGSLNHEQVNAGRISALLNPITFVIINLAVILLIHAGAIKVEAGLLTQGMVVALYNYMSQILVELVKMANLIITMTKAVACANRIQTVLEIPADTANGAEKRTLSGQVTFRNVTARYSGSGASSLEGISFTALPGQTIGIIGGTGAGKTTLVNLIPGFYSAAEGAVLLDGTNVSEFDPESLRSQIGIVPQKAQLFQ
jgi:ABC-type multidrug transport system fused ATPase/permease subunit